MPIDRRVWFKAIPLAAVALLAAFPLRAATIEVENDDEEIEASPVPAKPATAPAPVKRSPASQAVPTSKPAAGTAQGLANTRRVRVSDNVGFYYFVKAGYVADPDKIDTIGQVFEDSDANINYSTAKRTFIEIASDKVKVSKGDLLVVYRAVRPIGEGRLGPLGFQVENLAIVRVVETQGRRDLVEVVKSFRPFQAGDKIQAYDNEIQRWKQAQIKKSLPSVGAICSVVGGQEEGDQESYNQPDFIFLSAGTKKGVVEGQIFHLYKAADVGIGEDRLRTPMGEAQVLYAGPDCSTAQILTNSDPIEKGFEAEYKP